MTNPLLRDWTGPFGWRGAFWISSRSPRNMPRAGCGSSCSAHGRHSKAAWTGSYYNNIELSGDAALTRSDGDINFNWGTGSPSPKRSSRLK